MLSPQYSVPGLASAPAAAQDTGHVKVQDDFSSGSLSHLDMPFPRTGRSLVKVISITSTCCVSSLGCAAPAGAVRAAERSERRQFYSQPKDQARTRIDDCRVWLRGYTALLLRTPFERSRSEGRCPQWHLHRRWRRTQTNRRGLGPTRIAGPFLHDVRIARDVGLRLHPDLRRPTGTAFCFPLSTGHFCRADRGSGPSTETGDFLNLRLQGTSAECHPAATKQ